MTIQVYNLTTGKWEQVLTRAQHERQRVHIAFLKLYYKSLAECR